MAVPADDSGESGRVRLQVQSSEIVQNVNENATDLQDFGFRQPASPLDFVDIAAYRGERGELGELRKNVRRTDVTRVDDVIGPAKELDRLGAEPSMRVGNHSN